jgi:NDP-sugar pyrophosphorylase family protein
MSEICSANGRGLAHFAVPWEQNVPVPLSAFADIPAVILVGGLGTRLRSAVADRPKALAEITGRPFLAWLLEGLLAAGVRRAVLCTGYRGEMIEQAFGARYKDLAIGYSREDSPLGTGGALRAALPRIDSPTVLALNGDSLSRADLDAFAHSHFSTAAAVSLLLAQVSDTSRYGRVETDALGRVTRFTEKGGLPAPGWISAGVYLLQREVLESISAGCAVSLEREVFPAWIGRGLHAHRHCHAFLDIGTPASYARAAEFLQPV